MTKNPGRGNTSHDAEMTAWAESDEAIAAALASPTTHTGHDAAARAANRAMLEAAASADPASQALMDQARRRGRPGLNTGAARTGRADVWRVRYPDDLGAAIAAQAEREGRKVPELIRDAARLYLETRQAS